MNLATINNSGIVHIETNEEKDRYLQLFAANSTDFTSGKTEQYRTAPLLSLSVKDSLEATTSTDDSNNNSHGAHDSSSRNLQDALFPQYAFLGCELPFKQDPILLNTNTPWSAFICGSQGSGKSYTLACMLESCLFQSDRIGKLPGPLAGIVFHRDTRDAGVLCEAAYLCSLGIEVNVLVSRSNYRDLSKAYAKAGSFGGNLTVKPVLLQDQHMNIECMRKLMGVSDQSGKTPLYMQVVSRMLVDMKTRGGPFKYKTFKDMLAKHKFSADQRAMLDMRLFILESFLDQGSAKAAVAGDDIFAAKPGSLTIVDLSDGFLDTPTACLLFDICFSIFEQHRPESGMVLALHEAHKFMNQSEEADIFADHLLLAIREQRHSATRLIVATQEPTISPKLLDLCSMTFVHRFTSPDWLAAIQGHLAGASKLTNSDEHIKQLFEKITNLDVGQSFLFAPSAILSLEDDQPRKLGSEYVKFKTRRRLAQDGGRSELAIKRSDEHVADQDDDGSIAKRVKAPIPEPRQDAVRKPVAFGNPVADVGAKPEHRKQSRGNGEKGQQSGNSSPGCASSTTEQDWPPPAGTETTRAIRHRCQDENRCFACFQVGHGKGNKRCPLYKPGINNIL